MNDTDTRITEAERQAKQTEVNARLAETGAHPVIAFVTTEWDPTSIVVTVTWAMSDGSPLDRRDGYAWSVGKPDKRGRDLAKRLSSAIRAGVVLPDPVVKVDVYGHTYVSAAPTILARIMNADLRRLGF